jgi:hypothetical protein
MASIRVKFQTSGNAAGGRASILGNAVNEKDEIIDHNCVVQIIAPKVQLNAADIDPDKVYELSFTEVPNYVAPAATPEQSSGRAASQLSK